MKKMGKAYRLVRPKLTVQDVMDIRSNPDLRLTTSPFGITPAQYAENPPIYVGSSVHWKGKDMAYLEAKAPAVAAGLKKAIKISKKYAGTFGTIIWNGKLYPKKCIEQKKG